MGRRVIRLEVSPIGFDNLMACLATAANTYARKAVERKRKHMLDASVALQSRAKEAAALHNDFLKQGRGQ